MSRSPAPFLAFERGLHRDFVEHAKRDMEKLGIEVPATPKRAVREHRGGRPPKEVDPDERKAVATILSGSDCTALREIAAADHRTVANYLRVLIQRDIAFHKGSQDDAPTGSAYLLHCR